nr:hypothetical protein [Deinococcus sp.]
MRHSSRLGFWNAIPVFPVAFGAAPLISAVPDAAGISPATSRSSVLLPQPDGPTIATNSPLWTHRFTSCAASVPLAPP